MTETTLLLDSDIIAYKFAASSEEKFDWEGDGEFTYEVAPLEEVMPLVHDYIHSLIVKLNATGVMVCLSCPTAENWRLGVLPSYKQNRAGVRKPELLGAIKKVMAGYYPSYERSSLEADDIMGILSTHPKLIKGKKIIVSEDKDMKTIPGWLFNPAKDLKPRMVTEEEADYYHLYQTLVGDSTDNYKGCPGIGPVKAKVALMGGDDMRHFSLTEMWDRTVTLFESKGLTEADALVQAQVARICRSTDYDFKKREVVLWQPT